jgi:hypothetical protein
LVLLFACWAVIPVLGGAAVDRREARDTAYNNLAKAQAVAQVEAVRNLLGRAPAENELKELAKESLPKLHWDGRVCEIRYRFVNNKEYWLECLLDWDYHVYHSTESKRGWFTEPF